MSYKRKHSFNESSSNYNNDIKKPKQLQIKSKENLNAEPNESARKNPHTLQFKETYYREFTPELRRITANSPRSKYERRSGFDKTTIHYGQRKLLLSEIEFLTLVANELHQTNNRNPVVLVYAGAAPGLHTPMLTWMFPFIREFVLVDPAKFELDETKMRCKYRLIRECFTDEMAEQLRDEFAKDSTEVLLVSDIRTADHRKLESDETELRVEEDMTMQMKWHDIMKPYKSMFKFRLPYVGDNKNSKTSIEYLDGDIYFQIWEGKTSSETRLMVNRDAPRKEYDCVWYEDTLFRFNTVERVLCYEHSIQAPGLDHCYDCRCEVHIFDEFVKAKSVISDLCEWRGLKKFEPPGETVTDMVNVTNRLLNASRKTDAVKLTLDGKTRLYSVIFTDVQHGVDMKTLFNDDKVVERRYVKYNSSDEDDDKADIVERNKSECRSIHTLECKHSEYKDEEFGHMRILTNDYREKIKPKERYRMPDRTTIYYKERSLRLSEIEFLSLACSEIAENPKLVNFENRIVLIYAGAGPSRGLEMLLEMFPFLKIVVYEPRKFQVTTSSKLKVYQEYINEQVALQLKEDYADYIRLFISNIKRADNFGSPENTRLEKEDLYLQMNIFRNLQPFKSMLRFRLPYPDERLGTKVESEYLEGTILFKLWSNCVHNEGNLIVDEKSKMQTYSYMKFKNQLHRFNTVERCQLYRHDLSVDGIDHCYDCRGEVYIFQLYENKKDKILAYFKCREIPNKKRPIEEWISELNHLLDANNKMVSIQYNQKKYWIRFSDVRYGKTLDEVEKNVDNNTYNYRQYNNVDKRSELSRRLDFSSKAVR